jgi:hypothetical protein
VPRIALARSAVCVPKTSSKSCDQAIFVDQATDASVSSDAVLPEIDLWVPETYATRRYS